jgi:hypothetical protein
MKQAHNTLSLTLHFAYFNLIRTKNRAFIALFCSIKVKQHMKEKGKRKGKSVPCCFFALIELKQ